MIKDFFGNWKPQAVDILVMISLFSVYSRKEARQMGESYLWRYFISGTAKKGLQKT